MSMTCEELVLALFILIPFLMIIFCAITRLIELTSNKKGE
jgi:hypothetical protein